MLEAGQLVSVDVGVIYDGWHGDGARTLHLRRPGLGDGPRPRPWSRRRAWRMMAGIGAAVAGAQIGDISAAVEDVAVPRGLRDRPPVRGPRHRDARCTRTRRCPTSGAATAGITLRAGHCLAIEPMLTLGSEATQVRDDNWTVATWDGSLAAHFEHTIAVTADGPEILTRV